MDYTIRPPKPYELCLLEDFLYEAIFIPEGVSPPPRSILKTPELQSFIERFDELKDDRCLFAVVEGRPVGAVWVRTVCAYGQLDDKTPAFAIALHKEYRSRGIGTALMRAMLELLKSEGCVRASLSVQRENRALNLYERLGFKVIAEDGEELLMVVEL